MEAFCFIQQRTKFGTAGHFRPTEHAKSAMRTVLYTLTGAIIFNAPAWKQKRNRWEFASKNSNETRKNNAAAFELVDYGLTPIVSDSRYDRKEEKVQKPAKTHRIKVFSRAVPRRLHAQARSMFTVSCGYNGTYSQSFAPNSLRGEQIGALFNSHSFCTVVVDVESLEDLCGRKKGQLCSAIAFGSSLCALQRRIHVNLTRSQQEQRIFEETFTDWLWRLVGHVEDSLNGAGLLAFTTLLLMPAYKSKGWSLFRLQTPHIK